MSSVQARVPGGWPKQFHQHRALDHCSVICGWFLACQSPTRWDRDEHTRACGAGARRNITRMPAFQGFDCDAPATVRFGRGQSAAAVDVVVYATGYVYSFPFLEGAGIVKVDRNRVHPLFRHVWPPAHAPGIAFVGIPWKVNASPPAREMHMLGKAASILEANSRPLGRSAKICGRLQVIECRLGGDYGEFGFPGSGQRDDYISLMLRWRSRPWQPPGANVLPDSRQQGHRQDEWLSAANEASGVVAAAAPPENLK